MWRKCIQNRFYKIYRCLKIIDLITDHLQYNDLFNLSSNIKKWLVNWILGVWWLKMYFFVYLNNSKLREESGMSGSEIIWAWTFDQLLYTILTNVSRIGMIAVRRNVFKMMCEGRFPRSLFLSCQNFSHFPSCHPFLLDEA